MNWNCALRIISDTHLTCTRSDVINATMEIRFLFFPSRNFRQCSPSMCVCVWFVSFLSLLLCCNGKFELTSNPAWLTKKRKKCCMVLFVAFVRSFDRSLVHWFIRFMHKCAWARISTILFKNLHNCRKKHTNIYTQTHRERYAHTPHVIINRFD